MQIISGSSNPSLAKQVANLLNIPYLISHIHRYNDGEIKARIDGQVGKDIILIQSTNTPVNDHLMELLLLADAASRSGASNITTVVPYLGYSRQDRSKNKNESIALNVIFKILKASPIDHIVTFDLHSMPQKNEIELPLTNIGTDSLFIPICQNLKNTVIVSPDTGGISRAKKYSHKLGIELIILDKVRDLNDHCIINSITGGDVSNKNCIIIDDIVDSGNTLCRATELLMSRGALSVEAIITHAILSNNAINNIDISKLSRVHVTDSIYHQQLPTKFITHPICKLISQVLEIPLSTNL